MKNNNGKIIGGLIVIIIILSVFCILFATNTLELNSIKVKGDGKSKQNNLVENKDKQPELEVVSDTEALTLGKDLYDKATEIYSTWVLTPYCGYGSNELYNHEGVNIGGQSGYLYYESMFNNIDELREYLLKYLSQDIVNSKVPKNVLENQEGIADYIIYNNKLYCRQDAGKGWLFSYLGKYDIKVNSKESNKISYTITSYYTKNEDKCSRYDNFWSCDKSDTENKDTNFTIEKINDKWIVTDYTLYE